MSRSGRTTRAVILPALIELSRGNDVTVVAFDMPQAVVIARRIVSIAKALGIPCANIRTSGGEGPHVRARRYDLTVACPTPRAKVFVDHTATFERPSVRPDSIRTVIG